LTSAPSIPSAAHPSSSDRWRAFTWAAALVGAILRLVSYLHNPSFWGDEAYVALNLRNGGPLHLLGALHATVAGQAVPPQSAPPLYLWSLYGLTHLLGQSEYVYRLPAFVMGIAALPLMAWVARRLLSPPATALATALLALCPFAIYHTVMVKQYSGDLVTALAMLAIMLPPNGDRDDQQTGRYLRMCVAAALLVWWSEAAIFVWAGFTLAELASPRQRRSIATIAVGAAVTLASFGALYFLSIRWQQDPKLYDFWSKYFPDYHRPLSVPLWIAKQLFGLADYPYRKLGPLVVVLCILGGMYWFRSGRRRAVLLLLGPIAATLAAGLLGRYPFGGCRLCLFLLPSILLLAAAGIESTATAHRCWATAAAAPMLCFGITIGLVQAVRPNVISHLRPIEEFLRAHRLVDEPIYVVGQNTWPVFFVYWPDPPGTVIVTNDAIGVTPPATGKAWLICEYGKGEYGKPHGRKEAIDRLGAGGDVIQSDIGVGGAAFEVQFNTDSH
jgi:hypothetical protein